MWEGISKGGIYKAYDHFQRILCGGHNEDILTVPCSHFCEATILSVNSCFGIAIYTSPDLHLIEKNWGMITFLMDKYNL